MVVGLSTLGNLLVFLLIISFIKMNHHLWSHFDLMNWLHIRLETFEIGIITLGDSELS